MAGVLHQLPDFNVFPPWLHQVSARAAAATMRLWGSLWEGADKVEVSIILRNMTSVVLAVVFDILGGGR